MAKFFTSFLALLFTATLFAQSPVRFYEKGKVGYKTADGKVIVAAAYDAGGDFSEGFAIVLKNGKRGYINTTGELIIALQYDDAGQFKNGIARVMKDKLYGFINTKSSCRNSFFIPLCRRFFGWSCACNG